MRDTLTVVLTLDSPVSSPAPQVALLPVAAGYQHPDPVADVWDALTLHLTPDSRVSSLAPQVALLLVVAGYQHLDSLADVSADGLRQHFEVNSIGPLLAVQALRPWLVSGTKARDLEAANV